MTVTVSSLRPDKPPDNDYGKADEELYESARRTMFAYLAGLITGKERDALTAMYSNWHAEHKDNNRRFGACAECEKREALAMLTRKSPLLEVVKK